MNKAFRLIRQYGPMIAIVAAVLASVAGGIVLGKLDDRARLHALSH
jgi:uncharacterized membrane protein YeiH